MTGTLDADFLSEFRKANVEPIIQVAIALSSPSSHNLYISNKRDFDNYGTDTTPILASITNVSQEIDPLKRAFQVSTMQVEVLDTAYIRSLIVSHDWINSNAYVTLGAGDLDSSQYAPLFYGQVERVYASPGLVTIDLVSKISRLENTETHETFSGNHPLVVLKTAMEYVGIPAADINAASFTQTSFSALKQHNFSTYGYHVYTRGSDMDLSDMGGRRDPDDIYTRQTVNSTGANGVQTYSTCIKVRPDKFAQEYCELTDCVLIDDMSSDIRVVRPDGSAAVDRHFTTDDYTSFEQNPDAIMFNRFKVDVGSGQYSIPIEVKDAAAITLYGEREYTTQTDYFANAAATHFSTVTSTTLKAMGFGVNGFCGCIDLKAGTQTSDDKIGASNPFYCFYRGGIFKSTTPHTDALTTHSSIPFQVEGDGAINGTDPIGIMQLGVSGLSVIGGASLESGLGTYTYDVTIAYQFLERALARYSNGAPRIKFVLPYEHLDLEICDTISIDNDWFAYPPLDLDGLDSSTKFEIVKKEVRITGDTVGIYIEAVYISGAGPTVTVATPNPPKLDLLPIRQSYALAAEHEATSSSSVLEGCTVSATSGLGYRIALGSIITGGSIAQFQNTFDLTATASKDSYIGVSSLNGSLILAEVSTGAVEPALGPFEIRLAKVVSNGSAVTGVTDLRQLGAISIKQINRDALEPGKDLVWNGGFKLYPNNGAAPPGWAETTSTPGTDFIKTESTVYDGKYAVHTLGTGTVVRLVGDKFTIDKNKVYRANAFFRQDSAENMKFAVYWWKGDRSASSTAYTFVHNANLSSTGAWIQLSSVLTPPSDAVYASMDLYSANSDESYMNNASLKVEPVSFMAYGASVPALVKDTLSLVKAGNESHDYGGHYDETNYEFTAPEDGVYEFSASIKINVTTGPASGCILTLKKDTSVFKEAHGGVDSLNDTAGGTIYTGPVELEEGDEISFYVTLINKAGTIQTGASETYFSGRKIS